MEPAAPSSQLKNLTTEQNVSKGTDSAASSQVQPDSLSSQTQPTETGCCSFAVALLSTLLEWITCWFCAKDPSIDQSKLISDLSPIEEEDPPKVPSRRIEWIIDEGCWYWDETSDADYQEILEHHLPKVNELIITFYNDPEEEENAKKVLGILTKLPHLRKIKLQAVPECISEAFFLELSKCRSLRCLQLGLEPAHPHMIEAIEKLTQLEGLDLLYVQELTDKHLIALSKHLQQLKYLNLGRKILYSEKPPEDLIMGEGVLALVKANPLLEVMVLSEREKISPSEHYQIAQALGNCLKFIALDNGELVPRLTLALYLEKSSLEGVSLSNQQAALNTDILEVIEKKRLCYVDIFQTEGPLLYDFNDFYTFFDKEGWKLKFIRFGHPNLKLNQQQIVSSDENHSSNEHKIPYSEKWQNFEYIGCQESDQGKKHVRVNKEGTLFYSEHEWKQRVKGSIESHQHNYLNNYTAQFKEAANGTDKT
jgi:hypothetical protein